MPMDPTILRDSKNPRELVDTARRFAVSADAADHQVLARYLGSTEFLDRLDPPEAYEVYQPHQLGAARIVKTLMDQETAAPRQTLIALTSSQGFQSYDLLIELLIRALAVDRPASARTISYWEKYIAPESVYADNVVRAVFTNQSRPALELFERVMNDPAQDDEYRSMWLRDMMLLKRNETPVLECCERMVIGQTVDGAWHESIIEALFDFNPSWYGTCRMPKPPLRVLAANPSKDSLERLGRHALTKMQLQSPGLDAKIRLAMKEIGRDWEDDDEVS